MRNAILTIVVTSSLLLGYDGTTATANDESLIGHWPLMGDARDRSGYQNHGVNHGVGLTADRPALFDGRNCYVEVPHSESLALSNGEFSIAVSVNTEADLDDVVGDLLSKFDSTSRAGFQLSIKNHAGVTSSQSNDRHLHFGIDNGQIEPEWTDHGHLGDAILVYSMAVYNGQLFAGTCVPGKDSAGHVYRFDGDDKWIDCGSPDLCNSVSSLAVLNGELYAGTARYRLRGSSLTESGNPHNGGNVYRYKGDGKWAHCGNLPGVEAINGMVAYEGKMYASSMYAPAALFRYNGAKQWTSCGVPDGKRVEALAIYNGYLYATGYDEGAVYRFDGKDWTHVGQVSPGSTQTYGFTVYQGSLHVSEWPKAEVYHYDGINQWTSIGKLGNEKESMPLTVYNGKMYSGTLPLAAVYRYDGGTKWASVGRVDMTPDVRYRRAWSMAVFQGRLFVGTLPGGRVLSIEAGRNATYDTAIKPGWRHIAACRDKHRLRLYVDGKFVASSATFDAADYDLSNDEPLKIGFGSHDYFNGQMKNLRLYRRALTETDVRKLVSTER
jgi:hypothetical protein